MSNSKTEQLLKKKCLPCEGGVSKLSKEEVDGFLKELSQWKLAGDNNAIYSDYLMKNFMAAIHFINEIAKVAEEERHHPDIHLSGYRKLKVEISTHAIGGLSENDFILAAKIDKLPRELKG